MTTKAPLAASVADDMSKEDVLSSRNGDVEVQPGSAMDTSQGHLKRDLGSRHINMIAIAGMIVRCLVSLVTL